MNENYDDRINNLIKLKNEKIDDLDDIIENLKYMLEMNNIKDINLFSIVNEIDKKINEIELINNKINNLKILKE